jgi:hypothetical protein
MQKTDGKHAMMEYTLNAGFFAQFIYLHNIYSNDYNQILV